MKDSRNRNLYQKLSDLNSALREWAENDRKGTRPRKVRANSSETKQASRERRVKRDRAKGKMTKQVQKCRAAKGRNVRTGK